MVREATVNTECAPTVFPACRQAFPENTKTGVEAGNCNLKLDVGGGVGQGQPAGHRWLLVSLHTQASFFSLHYQGANVITKGPGRARKGQLPFVYLLKI